MTEVIHIVATSYDEAHDMYAAILNDRTPINGPAHPVNPVEGWCDQSLHYISDNIIRQGPCQPCQQQCNPEAINNPSPVYVLTAWVN